MDLTDLPKRAEPNKAEDLNSDELEDISSPTFPVKVMSATLKL
jgi:hypothetical protein